MTSHFKHYISSLKQNEKQSTIRYGWPWSQENKCYEEAKEQTWERFIDCSGKQLELVDINIKHLIIIIIISNVYKQKNIHYNIFSSHQYILILLLQILQCELIATIQVPSYSTSFLLLNFSIFSSISIFNTFSSYNLLHKW